MKFEEFSDVFTKTIFGKSKKDLLEKLASNPERYIGLFRPTKPKAKLLQNLLQSHEIKFGDAFEEITERYIKENGGEMLGKQIKANDGKALQLDQHFIWKGQEFFMEQKMRDDHDSTKKVGQIDNFEKKLTSLQLQTTKSVTGIFYFVDDTLTKNQRFYSEKIAKIGIDYHPSEAHLFYGDELFNYLGIPNVWSEILSYLERWKKDLPDIPEIDFDKDADQSFEEIQDLEVLVFRKLFSNQEIFKEVMPIIFPEQKTLRKLYDYFNRHNSHIYQALALLLKPKLK